METQSRNTSDLLVLLVGSNPLPIYVTARYLLSRVSSPEMPRPNAVLLFYSNDTRDYAMAIKDMLRQDLTDGITIDQASVGDSQRDLERLHTAITEEIARIAAQRTARCSSVHLNITGGTKPMAVASYETVCSFVDGHLPVGGHTVTPRLLVSDIDPDHHKLRVYERTQHSDEGARVQLAAVLPQNGDLRQGITLRPEDLAALHLLTVSNPGASQQIIGSTIDVTQFAREALEDLADKENSALLTWEDSVQDSPHAETEQSEKCSKKPPKSKEAKPSQLKDLTARLANSSSTVALRLSCVRDACPSLAPFFAAVPQDGVWLFEPDDKKPSAKELAEFLEGKWLEEYIFGVAHAALDDFGARTKIGVSTNLELHVFHNKRERELDVYGICGYSSVLLSCTTEQGAGWVKLKAFEAFQRARELGGDHAETIVVSLISDPLPVRDDLTSFDAEQHVHILGCQDVQDELDGKQTITKEIQRIMEG